MLIDEIEFISIGEADSEPFLVRGNYVALAVVSCRGCTVVVDACPSGTAVLFALRRR